MPTDKDIQGDSTTNKDEQLLMEELKYILLREDRTQITELRAILNSPEEIEHRIAEIVDKRVETRLMLMKKHLDKELGSPLNVLIDRRIEQSKEELINIMYPIMGQLVRKYIINQFQILKEGIEDQLKAARNNISPSYLWKQFRNYISGVNQSDELLGNLGNPHIEEIYVIQKNSGLLLGCYSKNHTADQDMIAGMLTAIKSFAEDAFQKGGEELEMIEWHNYKIIVQNFYSYYIAVALEGAASTSYRDELAQKLLIFTEKELGDISLQLVDDYTYQRVSERLKYYFR